MMRKALPVLLSVFCVLFATAQDLTVRNMEPLQFDTYASVHKRLDLNQNPCAVVRVSLPVDGVTFSGTNLIGSIDRIGAEYIVFMPAGSKKMYIQHPKFHELEVVFGHYGIERLESLATYRVTVNVPQSGAPQQKMQTLTIKVTPADAVVLIDNEIVENSSVLLAVGSHEYNVAAKGYESQSGTVNLTENHPGKLTVELDRKTASASTSGQSVAVTAPTQPSQPVPLQPQQPEIPQPSQPQSAPQPVQANASSSSRTFTVRGVRFTMMPVSGGTFRMGATDEQGSDAYGDEKPVHDVTLSSYMMGETEVTQALWQAVMGINPSNWKGDDLPVESVSWNDCQTFLSKLNELTGEHFRLPTEAEWEYAARGGNRSSHTKYSGSSNVDEVAWYDGNSGSQTHPVKYRKPNELGLYDMSGNVYEWCQDWFGGYSANPQTNPVGPSSGSNRVGRGGGWNGFARSCRVSLRSGSSPDDRGSDLGLRLAL